MVEGEFSFKELFLLVRNTCFCEDFLEPRKHAGVPSVELAKIEGSCLTWNRRSISRADI